VLAVLATLTIASGWRAFGKRPSGNRPSRLERSPNWKNGRFENTEPMHNPIVRALFAVHWGVFTLAYHAWTEPVERALAAAAKASVAVFVPKPGQSIEPSAPPPFVRWWPSLSGNAAEEDPIVSSGTEGIAAAR